MTENSRRTFLKQTAVGAAAAGAVVALPAAAAHASTPKAETAGPAHEGPFAVWVNDAASGSISVLVGEREVVHHDPALARTLARIAGRGATS